MEVNIEVGSFVFMISRLQFGDGRTDEQTNGRQMDERTVKCGSGKCRSEKCRSDKVWKAIRRKYSKVPDEILLSWLACLLGKYFLIFWLFRVVD